MPEAPARATAHAWPLLAGYVLVFAIASFGLFASLDDRLLWGDEAETATLAQNVLRFGVPRVDDGHNHIGHLGVRDANDAGIWIWSPWLDEYVVAASLAVAGESTFAARLPFAGAGLATIALVGWLAFRIERSHELAISAMLLLSTCLPFLLHARQARYYALLMFATTLLLLGVDQLLRGRRAGAVSVGAALAITFHSNYVSGVGPTLALIAFALLAGGRVAGLRRGTAIALAILALVAVPWLVYAGAGSQAASISAARLLPNLVYYLGELHFHVVPWIAIAIPALLLWRRREAPFAARDLAIFIALLVGFQLALLGLSPFRFFRYLMPLAPALLLLTALLIHAAFPRPGVRIAVVLLLVTSNAVAWASGLPFARRHPLDAPHARFAWSLTQDYEDRLEAVVEYLVDHADRSQSLAVPDPEFPLVFHTGLAIHDARRRGAWPPAAPPDWILPVSPSAIANKTELAIPRDLAARYRAESLPVPHSLRGGSRPDPHGYEMFTAEESETFRLYRLQR